MEWFTRTLGLVIGIAFISVALLMASIGEAREILFALFVGLPMGVLFIAYAIRGRAKIGLLYRSGAERLGRLEVLGLLVMIGATATLIFLSSAGLPGQWISVVVMAIGAGMAFRGFVSTDRDK